MLMSANEGKTFFISLLVEYFSGKAVLQRRIGLFAAFGLPEMNSIAREFTIIRDCNMQQTIAHNKVSSSPSKMSLSRSECQTVVIEDQDPKPDLATIAFSYGTSNFEYRKMGRGSAAWGALE